MTKYFIQAGTNPAGVIPASLIWPYTLMARAFHREAKIQVQIHSCPVQVGILIRLDFIQGKHHRHQA